MPNKKKPEASWEIPVERLQYWATQPIGGSGLSVSIQKDLKVMATEILESRGISIIKPK